MPRTRLTVFLLAIVLCAGLAAGCGDDTKGGANATPVVSLPFDQVGVSAALFEEQSFMPATRLDAVKVVVENGVATVQVQPNLGSELDAVTIASHTAVVANKAVWQRYPEAQAVRLELVNELTSNTGQRATMTIVMIEVTKASSGGFNYNTLKSRVLENPRYMYCVADHYQIFQQIWDKIPDKGCLKGPVQ